MAYTKEVFRHPAELVWAAACAAQRINGTYAKSIVISDSDPSLNVTPNRDIMRQMITENTVTTADVEQGKLVRKYFQGLTFQILKGKTLNEFQNNALAISTRDEIVSNYDIAVIASLPSSYERGRKSDDVAARIRDAKGGHLDRVGAKGVTTNVEVLRCIFSQQWMTYFVTGITDRDQPVFFAYKNPLEIGLHITIRGNVKAHRDDSTQLNRVKVIN